MARRRSYKSKTSFNVFVLDKYTIGRWFVVMWTLYFFALFMAPNSPILQWFHQASYFVFGKIGTPPFFVLSIIFWLLVLFQWHLIRMLTKQFFILLFLVSALLNFPVLDNAKWNLYTNWWGYISWPIFWLLSKVFGDNPMAVKWMIITLFFVLIIWIFYKFNIPVPIPRLNIRLPEQKKLEVRDRSTVLQKQIKKISEKNDYSPMFLESDNQWNLLKDILQFGKQNTSNNNSSEWILKTALKSTMVKAVDDKLHQKTMAHISFPKDKPTFDLSLLRRETGSMDVDHELLVKKAQMIQSKLIEFGVPVTIDWFDIWPSIIQIRVKPEAGIKISTIENLKQDITLATKSKALRIVAPIPGTDCVGVQIPHPNPSMVHLGDVLWSPDFTKSMQKNLTNLTLGKAIDGTNIIKSLEDMPHLLIAWATGSWKSVWVNDFILSLMYQNNPNELKFLMVDPKQVELEMYAWLPYLLAPIVTQAEKALKLLQWAVEEMEIRYTKLSKARVKKLSEYNEKFPQEQLYRIIFVIDELADLMMSGNKKEVESCITRIAQKARAVGIHLIVATQRPSVNVITWLIKANIPTRIAFGVVSQIDSRTILGIKGAEDLLGKWDLLYMDTTTKHPMRVQAPFVDTDEIEKIITALKKSYMKWLSEEDIYHPEIIRILEAKPEYASSQYGWGSGWDDDEIIEQAIEVILETRKASATLLQRKLNLWFARAARVMDELEKRGVVWPQDGARAREILI
jgi:FtsK/SpoIIIE family/Ftsk gamma domain/FtsK alpha domain